MFPKFVLSQSNPQKSDNGCKLASMKTTLYLADGLMRQAKEQAAKDGITLTKLIEYAVRDYLDELNRPSEPFELQLLTKNCGFISDASIADRNALYALMES